MGKNWPHVLKEMLREHRLFNTSMTRLHTVWKYSDCQTGEMKFCDLNIVNPLYAPRLIH